MWKNENFRQRRCSNQKTWIESVMRCGHQWAYTIGTYTGLNYRAWIMSMILIFESFRFLPFLSDCGKHHNVYHASSALVLVTIYVVYSQNKNNLKMYGFFTDHWGTFSKNLSEIWKTVTGILDFPTIIASTFQYEKEIHHPHYSRDGFVLNYPIIYLSKCKSAVMWCWKYLIDAYSFFYIL